MDKFVEAATARLAELRKQVADLEDFLRRYYAPPPDAKPVETIMTSGSISQTELVEGNTAPHKPVDNSEKRRKRRRSKMRPDAVAEHMQRIIQEVGRPMTRGDLVKAFEARDMEIPYEDKPRYIGTIAWRHKGRFVNIEGRGYWLRDLPLPAQSSLLTAKETI